MTYKKAIKNYIKGESIWLKLGKFAKANILGIILAEIIFGADIVALGFMAIIINPGYGTVLGTVYAIQVTALPAIPIQLAIAIFLKKIFKK